MADDGKDAVSLLPKVSNGTTNDSHNRALYASYFLTFSIYVAFGVFSELYTDIFYDVIDKNDYAEASLWSTVAYTTYAFCSFFTCPILATLSDSSGRRPIMIIAAVNDCLTYTALGFSSTNWGFTLLQGIQGGLDASTAVNYALLADIVEAQPENNLDDAHFEQQLTLLIAIRWAISGVGVIAGIWIGAGMYLLTGSYQWSMASSGILVAPAVVTTYAYLDETRENLKDFEWSDLYNAVASQLVSVKIIFTRRRLFWVTVVNFLSQFIISGISDVYLYWGEWKFGWDTTQQAIGVSMLSFALLSALLLSTWFGPSFGFAKGISALCIVCMAACIGCLYAQTDTDAYVSLAFLGFGFGCQPIIFSQMSVEVSIAEQGRLQGSNYAIMTVAWVAGPYFFWWLFDIGLNDDDNANESLMWLSAAFMYALAACIMYFAAGNDSRS